MAAFHCPSTAGHIGWTDFSHPGPFATRMTPRQNDTLPCSSRRDLPKSHSFREGHSSRGEVFHLSESVIRGYTLTENTVPTFYCPAPVAVRSSRNGRNPARANHQRGLAASRGAAPRSSTGGGGGGTTTTHFDASAGHIRLGVATAAEGMVWLR